jgi:hypothetical protein
MRRKNGRYWDWEQIVRLARSHPGSWVVRLPNEPARVVRTIRNRSAPELRLDDGVLEAIIRNEYRDRLGRQRGDIFVRFMPN